MDQTPLPPIFNLPAGAVNRWLQIDISKPLSIPLTRAEIDNLFFAIDHTARGVQRLQAALIDYTNGRLEEANVASSETSQQLAEASNRLRYFMNAVMMNAEIAK